MSPIAIISLRRPKIFYPTMPYRKAPKGLSTFIPNCDHHQDFMSQVRHMLYN